MPKPDSPLDRQSLSEPTPMSPPLAAYPQQQRFPLLGCLISAFWPILPAHTLFSSWSDGVWDQTPICARVARGQQLPSSSPRAASASNGKSSQMMAQDPLWKLWVKLSGAFSPLFFPKSSLSSSKDLRTQRSPPGFGVPPGAGQAVAVLRCLPLPNQP